MIYNSVKVSRKRRDRPTALVARGVFAALAALAVLAPLVEFAVFRLTTQHDARFKIPSLTLYKLLLFTLDCRR
jgi:hypothetical protein